VPCKEEEQLAPTARRSGVSKTERSAPPTTIREAQPARTESGIHPDRRSSQPSTHRQASDRQVSDPSTIPCPCKQADIFQRTAKPTTPPPQFAPPRPTTIQTAADGDGARLAPSIPQDPSQAPNKAKSVASDTRSDVIATQKARSHAPSVAPTTTTNVKHLVAESKFHDDTLCQLLDAARLNLIGTEAKRALHKAAKARVTELKELRVRGEVSLVSECV